MSITTQAKVEAILNRVLTAVEEDFLPERDAMAEDAIVDAFPGIAFAEVVVVDETLVVGQDLDVWPNRYPVVSIEALDVNGAEVDLTALIISDGFASLVTDGRAGDIVVISYTAGLSDAAVSHVAFFAAEMIAVGFATPLAVGMETLGDHSVAYRGGTTFDPVTIRRRLRTLARRVTSLPFARGTV